MVSYDVHANFCHNQMNETCLQSGNNDFGVKLGQNDTFDPI